MAEEYVIRLKGITKRFGTVVANHALSLEVRAGEILALLGENGSGKTTLMNILSGIYAPDAGQIYVDGRPVRIRTPRDAFELGIGMVHQHFKLVDVLTAAENIALGMPGRGRLNRRALEQEIRALCAQYGFVLDPARKIYDMSVGEKQTVEILKLLYRGARILILDEPTAVLTPQESERLFAILRNMRSAGKAIVLITHKLQEVLGVSDRVCILRRGELAGTVETASTNAQELTERMVGHRVHLSIHRPEPQRTADPLLQVSHLTCLGREGHTALQDVTFSLYGGEILGVAGVSGSGQRELCQAIAGLHPVQRGSIVCRRETESGDILEDITGKNPREISRRGIAMAFVPEDRLGMGLVASMDMVDNLMLKSYRDGRGPLLRRKAPRALSESLIQRLEIATPGPTTPVRLLSGGNVQKVLLGRELASAPRILLASYPVRGLDIHASYKIYDLLNAQKEQGVAILFVGEDLDVLLALCDRILVLCGGRISGIVDARASSRETLGLLMTQTTTSEEGARDGQA